MYENVIDIKTKLKDFKDVNVKFTVSSRNIGKFITDDIISYLKLQYIYCDFNKIERVFGHTDEYSNLYGGRLYSKKNAISEKNVKQLEEKGIGIALTLTNHFFSEGDYKDSYNMLKKYHKKENAIICTNDELAIRIKEDFPDFKLKASLIKNINTQEKIEESLAIYDYVVVSMEKNDDDEFLKKIKNKDRVVLFGNAACAYTCPEKSCYINISMKKDDINCSKNRKAREEIGPVFFNVKKFEDMGFNNIKLVPIDVNNVKFRR